jgi:glycosyltransferase involved in cell wall biosynthesis
VIDGKAGLVVPHGEERLQNALLRMLRDDQMRQRFGANGKALVRDRFDWGRIIGRVERIYESCIHHL